MVSVCTVPARGGRSCEHFGGYKTINRIPLPFICALEHLCTKCQPNICAQTVDAYFGRQFAVRLSNKWLTNISDVRLLSVCAQ